jgi:hypothetical protein
MKYRALFAGGEHCRRGKRWRAWWPAGLFALGAVLGGCQSAPQPFSLLQRSYHPDNVFADAPKLSPSFQRVAVLPVTPETAQGDLPEGCVALTPVLLDQLVKAKRFEVVAVDAGRLRRATGRTTWTGAETLSADFLAYLRREYGCDGVLFAELTAYRAYAPLAVGWRLKLVDARSGAVIWAVDEVFDAARPDVARGVQRFTVPGLKLPLFYEDNWVAVNSPSQFGRYSAAALLETLPGR